MAVPLFLVMAHGTAWTTPPQLPLGTPNGRLGGEKGLKDWLVLAPLALGEDSCHVVAAAVKTAAEFKGTLLTYFFSFAEEPLLLVISCSDICLQIQAVRLVPEGSLA
uniref:Uncharacterized protein n=1 Tax=Micrurus surinamensis TaxID=129470 RepID=A0A2D4PPD5_MICSU